MKGFVRLMAVVVTAAVFVVACSKDKDSCKITLDSPAVFFAQAGGSATVGFTAQNIKTLSATSKPTGWDEAVVDLAGAMISVKAPSSEDIESGDAVKTGSFSFTGYTPGGTLVSATLFAGIVTTKDISAEVANSYIVTEPETNYLIDATRKGDGSQLATSYVDVVWQTASGFVQYADFEDGKASFYIGADSDDATKIKQGNAVIGAYDADGELIWSWHIWATDYDPDAEGGTVDFNGYTLMNRNLGALANDNSTTDKILASYGLYYQWGRKDPFPHPATCQDINKRADAVYAEGFEYAVSYPRNAGTESPYDNMTVEWSIAHPTTFMSDAMYEDWEEWTSVADWLYNHHPNLWGNVTTSNNNISKVSLKSIYDPCPVGWKVPSPEDFAGIERVSQSSPYYVTIHYNGNRTTNIPTGGTFVETRFMNNGQLGRLYTNAPYNMHWGTWACRYGDISCTSIFFSTGSVPSFIGTTDYYRYAANPIRCIRE